jgi:hypothetical protein
LLKSRVKTKDLCPRNKKTNSEKREKREKKHKTKKGKRGKKREKHVQEREKCIASIQKRGKISVSKKSEKNLKKVQKKY